MENEKKTTVDAEIADKKILRLDFDDRKYLGINYQHKVGEVKADCAGPTDCPDCTDCGTH